MQKELLEYQRLDGDLRRMKRELEKNEFRVQCKKYNQMRQDAEGQLEKLEVRAAELKNTYANLEKDFQKLTVILHDYLKLIEDIADIGEVTYMKRKINAQLDQVANCERECRNVLRDAELTAKQYDEVAAKLPVLISNYNKCNNQFNRIISAAQPKVKEMQAQQSELEKLLDPQQLELYKKIRQHDIHPVFVEYSGGSCGGCRMEISGGAAAKLNETGQIRCEHCGRIIYKN